MQIKQLFQVLTKCIQCRLPKPGRQMIGECWSRTDTIQCYPQIRISEGTTDPGALWAFLWQGRYFQHRVPFAAYLSVPTGVFCRDFRSFCKTEHSFLKYSELGKRGNFIHFGFKSSQSSSLFEYWVGEYLRERE